MVRHEDERAQALRDMGAEVVVGDLLDLNSMHRVIAGCDTMYFSMSISDTYLAATVNAAAVAKHHGVKAFINSSQKPWGHAWSLVRWAICMMLADALLQIATTQPFLKGD